MRKRFPLFDLAALLLVCIALVFSFYNQIPKNLSFDEVEFGRIALSLDDKQYSPYTTLANGHSTLYFYVLLLSFKLLGVNNLALRLPSALFSLGCVVFLFLIIRQFFLKEKLQRFLIALVVFVFITSRWFFHFARFSFEATFLLFLELGSLYFFLQFRNSKKYFPLFLSALFAGLAFHSYYPGRLFFVIPLVFLFANKEKFFTLLYLLVFFIISSPLIFYLLSHPDTRIAQLFYFSNPNLSLLSKLSLFIENLKKNALMFFTQGDLNGRHNFTAKPATNPIVTILFVSGLVIALKNIRSFPNQVMLLYFTISLLPTLFSLPQDNPNMLRSFTILPALASFVGVSVNALASRRWFVPRKFLISGLVMFILLSSFYEIRTYFVYQSRVMRNSFEVICPLDQVVYTETFVVPKKCRVLRNEF